MKKTIGSMVVIDTSPARFTHSNLESNLSLNADLAQAQANGKGKGKPTLHDRLNKKYSPPENFDHDKYNQATYLFFPIFGAFLLILLSTLSTPIIEGLSIAEVNMGVVIELLLYKHIYSLIYIAHLLSAPLLPIAYALRISWAHAQDQDEWALWSGHRSSPKEANEADMNIGALRPAPSLSDKCSADRAFSASMTPELTALPEPVNSLAGLSEAIRPAYLIANGTMHILACLVTWATLTWTLAAAGSWRSNEVHAHKWTRRAFASSGVSALFILIAWSLDMGMFTRISDTAITVEGNKPRVKPGAAIIMNLFAFLLTLGSYITHLSWGRFQPRPAWTIKGANASDYNVNPANQPPMSAALPPSDDLPPTWDSLNIADARQVVLDEKTGVLSNIDVPSVEQRGFVV
ncbi:hypothetical protein I316_00390 [Kwoniella heveanensis BCC8398]|uniref:Uncharacterized protein n=1 Tax=Kwoniella heveanensis BCC8398 TaxID=1296120 RepID=A0A1B9H4H0_9TREE|nr:hypothetical protein I316_00390 [Kwoniella heveanensis BCC8398]